MKIVTSQQMRRIEEHSADVGVSTDTLMENAGRAVAEHVRGRMGRFTGETIVVLVGPGNNGGDGLVAARHLYTWGARTLVYLCTPRPAGDPQLDAVEERGVPTAKAEDDPGLARLKNSLSRARIVLDAVLGTGRSRPIEGVVAQVFAEVHAARAGRAELETVALDVPSGLDSDTGAVDEATPVADVTVTLGYPKVGLFQMPGAEYAGRIETAYIRIPPGLDRDVTVDLITDNWARKALPKRGLASHKGSFGKTLVVAGSRNYLGAAALATTAAARVGSGLVTLALPASLQAAVAARAVEATYIPLAESEPGVVSPDAVEDVIRALPDYDALVVGCGVGQAEATRAFLARLMLAGKDLPPTVVDADGLNFLAGVDGPPWWEGFTTGAVVTPHPGEMARLFNKPAADVQRRRLGVATEAAARWNKVTVLKGAYTVVAEPGGTAMVSPFANAGLASAGTGDVLAGAIGGFLSQGLSLNAAASLGVYVHGLAGEMVRDDLGDAGMLASDVLSCLPRAIKRTKAALTV